MKLERLTREQKTVAEEKFSVLLCSRSMMWRDYWKFPAALAQLLLRSLLMARFSIIREVTAGKLCKRFDQVLEIPAPHAAHFFFAAIWFTVRNTKIILSPMANYRNRHPI